MAHFALLLIAGTCAGLPDPPFTSRAAESAWGDPVDGLSLLVVTDADTLPLGATIRTELFFRYNPFLTGRPEGGLIQDLCVEEWTLVLRSVDTGRTWERTPYEGRSIGHFHTCEEIVPFRYGEVASAPRDFSLVGISGEQIPAGAYDVSIRYRNEGDCSRYRVAQECIGSDLPSPLWAGTVETGALRLRILHREADTTHCRLPTAISVFWDEERGSVEWAYAPDSWEGAVLISQPGFHLSFLADVRNESVDPSVPLPQTVVPEWRMGGSLPDRTPGLTYHVTRRSADAPPEHPIRVTVHARIVETPRFDGGRYAPGFDFDPPGVLWERTFNGEGP
jgi:hypothetical protein